jgi:hypothetical protein
LQEVHNAEFGFGRKNCLKCLSQLVRLGVVRRAKRIDLIVESFPSSLRRLTIAEGTTYLLLMHVTLHNEDTRSNNTAETKSLRLRLLVYLAI